MLHYAGLPARQNDWRKTELFSHLVAVQRSECMRQTVTSAAQQFEVFVCGVGPIAIDVIHNQWYSTCQRVNTCPTALFALLTAGFDQVSSHGWLMRITVDFACKPLSDLDLVLVRHLARGAAVL